MLLRILFCFCLGQFVLCNAWLSGKRCFREMYKDFQCYGRKHNTFRYPESPTEQGIHFKLYTPKNRQLPQILGAMDIRSVRSSFFDRSGKVAFLIHGFSQSSRSTWLSVAKDKLLSVVPNVIVVDWEEGADGPDYTRAAANTRVAGAQIATLIKTLRVDPASVHLIGFSLGAHVAGYAGEKFGGTKFHRKKIGRITGLDPAGPLFSNFKESLRLDPSDASFVDVIHTDAPVVKVSGLGTGKRLGHVDFYPHGGSRMPGCKSKIASLFKPKQAYSIVTCSHRRATDYFIASINDNDFQARPCRSRYLWRFCWSCGSRGCNSMGYHATPSPSGLFVLGTESSYPF